MHIKNKHDNHSKQSSLGPKKMSDEILQKMDAMEQEENKEELTSEDWEDLEQEEETEEEESKEDYGSLSIGCYPHYFHIPGKYLDYQPPSEFQHQIHMDEQCLKLAHFLHNCDIKQWLLQNSNPFTLMALARCIHMLSAPQLMHPAHLLFDEKLIKKEMKNKPNRRKRYNKFFNQLDRLINQFHPLFMKYHDLITRLLKNYAIVYK